MTESENKRRFKKRFNAKQFFKEVFQTAKN